MNKVKLSKLWDALHTSYWFLPGILAICAVFLAFAMLSLDRTIGFDDWDWIYTGGPDGAREVLSAIAGSMVSVAATAFSITIVALQLASANFGPRLLRNFMRDTGNQIVLGTFIATFIYCLLVLRAIYGEDYNLFIPHLSVTVSIVLAILSIAVLIYFIHHASTIIQASHVIESVSQDLDKAIDRLFPEKIGVNPPADQPHLEEIPPDFQLQAYPIKAHRNGYLQAINDEKLLDIARKYNLLIHVKSRPGNFVVQGSELVMVWPGERVNRKLNHRLQKTFILGKERTEQQDIEFPLQQLVEIALRAISPGINDPFTAIRCIDRLSAGLCNLVQRQFPSPYRYDDHKQLRVIAKSVTFEGIVDQAFNQIRQDSRTDAAVTIHLLNAIALVATYTHNPQYHQVLKRHADMIERGSHQGLPESEDRQNVQDKYHSLIQVLNQNHQLDTLRR
ncbi:MULTISPECIES: DUF2254 domain-containing protein [unclassified Nodularia (in: cyanobacteria)]|uniref:DUF2254 domain-containing protein n=1 Tax=unclassified Nodularia (in: cyanobacteria) TaxID=2656917 RepID=UPI00188067E0|nr:MULTISPECIES: DUF2254 domain-containing protein [unclassified Nodularia (in: cyanobacteria)]MBE9200810.1 DUF2254 domain-containing protein [Nodularia sp. LEGE 06071]MCC2693808.1 DUF2254 domain-containing protein [Nodularia sp. LEGE 04288]